MAEVLQSKGHVIRLNHEGGRVIVEPADEDRFVITARAAVKACQDSQRQEEAIRIFKNELLLPLFRWCEQNSRQVKQCYVPVPTDHIKVFVVGSSSKYDFQLGEKLAKLELEFFDRGWKGMSILQLPSSSEEELATYFSIEGAIEAYAGREAA